MSKKNKKAQAGNQPTEGKKKIVKPFVLDEEKKKLTIEIISKITALTSFPKVTAEDIKKIVESYTDKKVNEKAIGAFCGRVTKLYSTITKKGKEKKSKEIDDKIKEEIKEAATITASRMSDKLFKCDVNFVKLIVIKKSAKKSGELHAHGKVIFKLQKDAKEYFLCWDLKKDDLFIGSTLHEYTEEVKEGEAKK
jgi:hypothetical protein